MGILTTNMAPEIMFENILHPHLANQKPSANLEFNDKINKLKDSGKNVAHFGFGQSPFPVPMCLQDALKEFAHVNTYLSMTGLKSLRKQLVKCHKMWDGIDLNEESFLIAPGTKELIFLTLANFNGVVLIPTPAWPTYHNQCHLAGADVVKIHCNEDQHWKVTTEAIREACSQLKNKNKMIIFTNPGNPTGQVYTKEEVMAISDVCKKEGIIVLSDEIYARITHLKDHFCMSKFYPEGTVLFTGFSKWLSIGGWRMGYAYFPPTLKEVFTAVNNSASHTYTCAPSPMQYALEKCLRENYDEMEEYRKNCCVILKIVGEFCYRELKSVGVGGNSSEAGYYYIPNFEVIRAGLAKKNILTGKQMTDAMLDEISVGLMATGSFARPQSELCVRFCFVCFDGNLALNNMDVLRKRTISENEIVEMFCPQLYEGVQNIKTWVLKHK